jgi:asparagine synthase (glutamine-hydrolysing)
MSAITGVWHLDGRPVDNDLTCLNAPLTHSRYETSARWTEGPVGFACHGFHLSAEPSSVVQPSMHGSGAVVAFDGRLDNRGELLDVLGPSPGLSSDAPDAAFVLAAYTRFGRALPERLLGDFALALFDPARQELLLARDPMGIRPLHYWRSPGTFLFASTIKSLLAYPLVPVRPDDAVVARFITGHVSDDGCSHTFFHGVSTLPPAHVAIISPQQFVTRQFLDFDLGQQLRLRGPGEYADAFRHYFDQAVERRQRSTHPVAVSLSGGLDSSAVYGAAETIRRRRRAQDPPVIGLSYVHSDHSLADETAYLREIEQLFGTTVECLPVAPASFEFEQARKEVWQGEAPFLSGQPSTVGALLDRAHGLGARVLLTGHHGDEVLVNEPYLIDLFRQFRWLRVWSDLREMPRWFTDAAPGIFARQFATNLIKHHLPSPLLDVYRRARRGIVPSAGGPPWYRPDIWAAGVVQASRPTDLPECASAYQESMYHALRSPSGMVDRDYYAKVTEMRGLELREPFLDRELVGFLLSIPGEMQTWRGVPKSLLRDAMRSVLPESIVGRRWKADLNRTGFLGGLIP